MSATAKRIKKEESEDESQSLAQRSPRAARTRRRRSWYAALFSIGSRLLVWYAILTAVFHCPGAMDQLDDESPAVCKPYLRAREVVLPHVKPYYDDYLDPYVQVARPYTDRLTTTVIRPGYTLARSSYDRYGAHRVAQLRSFGASEWQRLVQPQLDSLQAALLAQYDSYLGRHVAQATAAVGPYYVGARDAALRQYEASLLPAYRVASPYVQAVYVRGYGFSRTVVLPYLQKSGHVVYTLVTRRVWPPIRVLYGENVQPQLVKIRERLANYRDAKAIESAMDHATVGRPSSAPADGVETAASAHSASMDVTMPTVLADTVRLSDEAQSLGTELRSWRLRFANATDKGIRDLQAHVEAITADQATSQAAGTGAALTTSLEETVSRALGAVKSSIRSLAAALPADETDEDEDHAVEASHAKIRAAGKRVKEAAQRVRGWKADYVAQTEATVRDATEHTLEVMEHIRDLSLQEIGMRYAAHPATTHDEWKEYHALKKTHTAWRQAVDDAGTRHPGLEAARQAGEDVEADAMAVAEDAAMELARLKQVAVWKIRAKDSSDDFGTKSLPRAVRKAREVVADGLDDASELVSSKLDQAGDFVSEKVQAASDTVSSVLGRGESSSIAPKSAASDASSAVDSASSGASSRASSLSSSAASGVSSAADKVSDKISAGVDSAASAGSAASKRARDAASSASDSASSVAGAAGAAASSSMSSASSAASSAGYKASKSGSSIKSRGAKSASSGVSAASKSASGAVSKASASASSAAVAAGAAIENAAEALSSVRDQGAEVSGAASEAVANLQSKLSSSSTALASSAQKATSMAGKSAESASSTILPSSLQSSASSVGKVVNDHVSNAGGAASSSLSSAVNAAGDKYVDVTESAKSAMSSASSVAL